MRKLGILLVDDEVDMLDWLEAFIDWAETGYELLGRAVSAESALEMIAELEPDVLLTDIEMGSLNGLDLIEQARTLQPGLRSIILTCHADFDYARRAIHEGVDEYLLKYSITVEDVNRVLDKVRSGVLAGESMLLAGKVQKSQCFESLLTRDSFNGDDEALFERCFDLHPGKQPCRCILGFLETGSMVDDWFEETAGWMIRTLDACSSSEGFLYKGHTYVTFIPAEDVPDQISCDIDNLRGRIEQRPCTHVVLANSGILHTLADIAAFWQECQHWLSTVFYRDEPVIVLQEPVDVPRPTARRNIPNYSEIKGSFDFPVLFDFLRMAKTLQISPEVVNLTSSLILRNIEMKFRIKSSESLLTNLPYLFYDTLEHDARELYRMHQSFMDDGRGTRPEIAQVLKYTDTHYSDAELSSKQMADMVSFAPSYFSRLFRSEMGCTYSEYLRQVRIDESALLLLNTDLPVETIANRVGYKQLSYFSNSFRKLTGYSPSEIRSWREA